MNTTQRASCVIGFPAKHSRSPKLHGHWIKRYGIDGDYRIEEISPADFPSFVKNLAKHGYVGANVTLPHKETALALSEPDARAKADQRAKAESSGGTDAILKRGVFRRSPPPGVAAQFD